MLSGSLTFWRPRLRTHSFFIFLMSTFSYVLQWGSDAEWCIDNSAAGDAQMCDHVSLDVLGILLAISLTGRVPPKWEEDQASGLIPKTQEAGATQALPEVYILHLPLCSCPDQYVSTFLILIFPYDPQAGHRSHRHPFASNNLASASAPRCTVQDHILSIACIFFH